MNRTGKLANLAHKLKRTENVINGDEMTETEIEVGLLLLCKTSNNPETDSYE